MRKKKFNSINIISSLKVEQIFSANHKKLFEKYGINFFERANFF